MDLDDLFFESIWVCGVSLLFVEGHGCLFGVAGELHHVVEVEHFFRAVTKLVFDLHRIKGEQPLV